LKSGKARPDGRSDNAKRFKLKKTYDCCAGLRPLSRQYPLGQLDHGRSALHVAHANGIPHRHRQIISFEHLMTKYPFLVTGLTVSLSALAAAAATAALIEIAKSSNQFAVPTGATTQPATGQFLLTAS
jgi:hypothetical protein